MPPIRSKVKIVEFGLRTFIQGNSNKTRTLVSALLRKYFWISFHIIIILFSS